MELKGIKLISCLIALLFLAFASTGFSSQIKKIPLSSLKDRADIIVIAEVIIVDEEQHYDNVTIKVDSFLKGQSPQTIYTFTLITRGDLKDFDPHLKKGDTGVFFLKQRKQTGQVEKAYWGSVAIFQKNHFSLTETMNLSSSLNNWFLYRVRNGQVKEIEDYARGFQKGFAGNPGLVDGSAEFNLGHSDGMLAKTKKLPHQLESLYKKTVPEKRKFKDWYFQCIDKECKIFTYVEIPKSAEDDPAVHCYVLALKSNKDIVLQEVVDIEFQKKIFSATMPVEYIIKDTKTAPRQFHDAKGEEIILQFDTYNKISSTPSKENTNYCVFQGQKAEMLVNMFRKNREVVFIQKLKGLGFNYDIGEPYQKKKAVFSLIGFSKAYDALFGD
jgi:hypothetical protein